MEGYGKLRPLEEGGRMIRVNIEERVQMEGSLLQLGFKREVLMKAFISSVIVILMACVLVLTLSHILGREEYKNQHLYTEYMRLGGNSNTTIAKHLQRLSSQPHVAGTQEDLDTAEYVISSFKKYGLDAHFKDYDVFLTYPLKRSLVLTTSDGKSIALSMKEEEFDEDSYTKNPKVIPGFHAYSPSGEALGEVVYVNYGREEDFIELERLGISVNNAVVIARHGKIFRGDIVKNSAAGGALGVVMYSDPQDYGNKDAKMTYPKSRWLPNSGIQRGTVLDSSGDILSPGWPSTKDGERVSMEEVDKILPSIPSLPISADDALVILRSLGGPLAPSHWHGALDLQSYHVGRGPCTLNLTYVANKTMASIRNVVAVIRGMEEPDRYVLLGNHRDAWTFGAVDPNSGTSALLDIAERFGRLMKQGWKPRRSIVLCSWDAEEYGSVGSTEWVEQNFDLLYNKAVAYINVDCAVAGPGLVASATPQLDNLLKEAMKQVMDPDNWSQTLYQSWLASNNGEGSIIGRLGGWGSDFSAFLHHVGVPSIDIYFGKDFPVYHSVYDNYMWMEKFGDPNFHRHVAVAGLWGIVALKLANDHILPFDYQTYANEIQEYIEGLDSSMKKLMTMGNSPITTSPLHGSVSKLKKTVSDFGVELKALKAAERSLLKLQMEDVNVQTHSINERLMMAERAFTHFEGIPGKPWYKHLIYGPTATNNYGSSSFPGIADCFAKASSSNSTLDWAVLQHQIWRVSRAFDRASLVLQGHLA